MSRKTPDLSRRVGLLLRVEGTVGGGRRMGKMDERPTQRHIVTGDVSEDRTWYSTIGRLDEGEEEVVLE